MALTSAAPTLETTWAIQLRTIGSDWHFTGQGEYETEEDIHELGRTMYGGTCEYRPIRIDRTVCEAATGPNAKPR